MRFLDNETYFSAAAEQFLTLLTRSFRGPFHQNVRGLSSGEMGLLYCLYRTDMPLTAGELSHGMGIGSGGVANLLNSLENKGYIDRAMSKTDRRSVLVSISEPGRSLVEEKIIQTMRITEELLVQLGEDDTREMIRIYRRLLNLADKYMQQTNAVKA